MKVAQAVVSLRLRGEGERRVSVRGELGAEGLTPECSARELDAIIESVQNGLREVNTCCAEGTLA